MTSELNSILPDGLSKEEKYIQIIPQILSLTGGEQNLTANLANITSVLKHAFGNISWVGFYLTDESRQGELVLGPFQGKAACTRLFFGKGVCGTAAEKKETVLVDDVNKFPGHIFCDTDSRSEIVIPLIKDGLVKGVLDIDSKEYSSFDETDRKYLEELAHKIIYLFN